MRISDWSSDVCSSDLIAEAAEERERLRIHRLALRQVDPDRAPLAVAEKPAQFVSRADRGVEATGLVLDQARGLAAHSGARERSDERRVGTARVSTGRYRWCPTH